LQAKIIYADDFCQFVKEHGHAAVSRRLTYDALWFVQNYVFPPSHADLLSVRGTYTKRSAKEEEDLHDAEEPKQNA
jgi:Ni,Fe-hydrogenase III small subunit